MDISVCVLLLLSQRLEITLTAFVTTQDITATGKDRNSCAVLNIVCIADRRMSWLPLESSRFESKEIPKNRTQLEIKPRTF